MDLLQGSLTIGYSLWTQKFVLLEFYKKLVKDMPWAKPTLICYLVIFIITFCLSIIFTFVECHPFSLYWVVIPDPGKTLFLISKTMLIYLGRKMHRSHNSAVCCWHP